LPSEIVAVMGAVEAALKLVPQLAVETVESSCCGMAGAFGYGADTSTYRSRWRNFRCCRGPCGGRDTLVVATAPPAGTRSRAAPVARRCTLPRVLAMSVEAAQLQESY